MAAPETIIAQALHARECVGEHIPDLARRCDILAEAVVEALLAAGTVERGWRCSEGHIQPEGTGPVCCLRATTSDPRVQRRVGPPITEPWETK